MQGGGARRFLLAALLALPAIGVLLLGSWLWVFGAPLLGCAAFLAAVMLWPWRRAWRWRAAGVAALLVSLLAFRSALESDLGSRLNRLAHEKDAGGADAFGSRDRAGIYGLNLVMGVGGWLAGYPEVAGETLALCWPGEPVRHWTSDFALGSPKVRAAIRETLGTLGDAADGTERELPPRRVTWSAYGFDEDSMRVALALNSLGLEGHARREGPRWVADVVGTVRVAYPRRAFLPLGVLSGGTSWGLDEGLFWALQEAGWLHPYTAEWRWRVASDDPRLRETANVERTRRERVFRALVTVLR